MKAVIQRINKGTCIADRVFSGEIEKGLLVLLGVNQSDTKAEAETLAKKVANLRIFTDDEDKMNLSVLDIGGGILTVSNFTLCADTKKGNRPSYIEAMEPQMANTLYEYFMECLKVNGVKDMAHGKFGADMQINTELDGPVTIILDTDNWRKI